MVFPFLAAFVDMVTSYDADPIQTNVRTTYSDILIHLLYKSSGIRYSCTLGSLLVQRLEVLTDFAKTILEALMT